MSIHTLYAGGSFGRRANAGSDYIVEAVSIAKAYGADGTPIKLQWTREDDIHGGLYRPMYFHKLEAGLKRGRPSHRLAPRHRRTVDHGRHGPFAVMIKDGIDPTSVEGAANIAYDIPNIAVDLATTKTGVPVLWWRVVGSSHTTFAVEAFIDEVAHAAGEDPFTFRRKLLDKQPRMKAVLELAAEKAGWNTALCRQGKGRGIAVCEAFKSYVAQVAEVSVDEDGRVKVDRVVCAVDCGTAINPDIIAAQMEGGIGFGLGAVLYGAITLKDGRVEQDNFNGYRVLRMNEMPKVEVYIVPSAEPPTGVGEPGVAPVGPAVANAIFAATGKRHRVLPFSATRPESGLTGGVDRLSGGVEQNDAAALAPSGEVGKRLRRLVDRIGARDQLVELQAAAAIQADQARKVLARTRRSIEAAGQGLLAERHLLRVQRDLILRRGDTHDHRRPTATQYAPGEFGDLALANAVEGIIRAAAGQFVQGLADILLPCDVERVGGAEGPRQCQCRLAGVDRDYHRRLPQWRSLEWRSVRLRRSRTPPPRNRLRPGRC